MADEKILCVIGNEPVTMTKAAEIRRLYEEECSTEWISEEFNLKEPDARCLAVLLRNFMYEVDYPISEREALYRIAFDVKDRFRKSVLKALEPLRKEAVVNDWC